MDSGVVVVTVDRITTGPLISLAEQSEAQDSCVNVAPTPLEPHCIHLTESSFSGCGFSIRTSKYGSSCSSS
ncbi:hypothetical protein SLA2020_244320 [Shorea laevis]